MTTSGTYTFNPNLDLLIREAFERIGVDWTGVDGKALNSALNSLNYTLLDMANRGVIGWLLEQVSNTLTQGTPYVTTNTGTLDVQFLVLRRQNIDTELGAIGPDDYLALPNKTVQGRASMYFVDKQYQPPRIYLWPTPENSTDQIIYWRIRQSQDGGDLTDTVDVSYRFYEAVVTGVAYRLADKYNVERKQEKKVDYEYALELARSADRGRADLVLSGGYFDYM